MPIAFHASSTVKQTLRCLSMSAAVGLVFISEWDSGQLRGIFRSQQTRVLMATLKSTNLATAAHLSSCTWCVKKVTILRLCINFHLWLPATDKNLLSCLSFISSPNLCINFGPLISMFVRTATLFVTLTPEFYRSFQFNTIIMNSFLKQIIYITWNHK